MGVADLSLRDVRGDCGARHRRADPRALDARDRHPGKRLPLVLRGRGDAGCGARDGGVTVLALWRLLVPQVRATTIPVDYVALVLLLIVIITGIVPTIGVNPFGHGYDYRNTVAPWFRGL